MIHVRNANVLFCLVGIVVVYTKKLYVRLLINHCTTKEKCEYEYEVTNTFSELMILGNMFTMKNLTM